MTTKKTAKKRAAAPRRRPQGVSVKRPSARKPSRKKKARRLLQDPPLKLTDHLGELRSRFVSTLVVVLAACVAVFFHRDKLLNFLAAPAQQLIFTAPAEAFFTYLKLSVLGGLLLSLPWILFQAYGFIAPAIERKNRPWMAAGMATCLALFYTGGGFALMLLKPAMKFFLSFAGQRLQAAIKIDEYFSFVTTLALGCGLVFETPVAVWVLARLGLIDSRMLISRWREALVAILFISAFITPPDVFTMAAVALPMAILYLLSIYVAKLAKP